MKKLIAVILVVITMMSLAACTQYETTKEEVTVRIESIYKSSYYSTGTAVKGWKYNITYTLYCEEYDVTDSVTVNHQPGMAIPREYYFNDGDILTATLNTERDENGNIVNQYFTGVHK